MSDYLKNGVRLECVRKYINDKVDYVGRIAVYENGKRLYSVSNKVRRLTRKDAMLDAKQAAIELLKSNNVQPRLYYSGCVDCNIWAKW